MYSKLSRIFVSVPSVCLFNLGSRVGVVESPQYLFSHLLVNAHFPSPPSVLEETMSQCLVMRVDTLLRAHQHSSTSPSRYLAWEWAHDLMRGEEVCSENFQGRTCPYVDNLQEQPPLFQDVVQGASSQGVRDTTLQNEADTMEGGEEGENGTKCLMTLMSHLIPLAH